MNRSDGRIDPITLEAVRNRIGVVAQEMEGALIRSAFSAVLREGADCSCALFIVTGETMAQSVALPQHLGVLASTVAALVRSFPPETMEDGGVYMMNDPHDGGTHLPDITKAGHFIFRNTSIAATEADASHRLGDEGYEPAACRHHRPQRR